MKDEDDGATGNSSRSAFLRYGQGDGTREPRTMAYGVSGVGGAMRCSVRGKRQSHAENRTSPSLRIDRIQAAGPEAVQIGTPGEDSYATSFNA